MKINDIVYAAVLPDGTIAGDFSCDMINESREILEEEIPGVEKHVYKNEVKLVIRKLRLVPVDRIN